MISVQAVKAIEILDSRGNPTIQAQVTLTTGETGEAKVPSGASVGSQEAVELRDKGSRYLGKGVKHAVDNINSLIAREMTGHDVFDQEGIDSLLITLDGTTNKRRLGANAILAVSLASARAAAAAAKQPLYCYLSKSKEFWLPVPMMNIINGGVHADNNLSIQEFMILPAGFERFRDALCCGAEIFHTLKALLKAKGLNSAVGDEGGFAPNLPNNKAALDLILASIEKAGYKINQHVYLGLDIASSEFYKNDHYGLSAENQSFTSEAWVDYLTQLSQEYPIISIEDGMAEKDITGWIKLTKQLGQRIQLVGDDLFVTNTELLAEGIADKWANAILIKPNQIGTLTETFAAIDMAQKAGMATIMSHRSGETEDAIIADLAVAYVTKQIKTGSLCRSDRVAKYNRLLQIESELQDNARYAGELLFKNYAHSII